MDVTNTHIIILDDDKEFAIRLKNELLDIGTIDLAFKRDEFIDKFKPYKYNLVLLDMNLGEEKGGKEGLKLINHIMETDFTTAVIVISGHGDISTALEAVNRGARTYIEKSKMTINELKLRIENALREVMAERRIKLLEADIERDEIIGSDIKIQALKGIISLVAQDGEATVLIRGETGTGKELVARAIHRIGMRSDGPFVSVALTDVNAETIVSELFGHERGSFTGAFERHLGYFEQSHKGLLFLDEIGELPIDIQAKLLRILDDKSVRRMGSNTKIKVDVQVITATNRDLEDMVKLGKFREDLYYRLKVFEITLPALRERLDDIPVLASYFLQQLYQKGRSIAKNFSDDAIGLMLQYRWPGNVRELKAVVESVALRSKLEGKKTITKKQLLPHLISHKDLHSDESNDIFRVLAETELRYIDDAMKKSDGKKTEAYKLLNYSSRFSFYRRVKNIINDFPDIAEGFPTVKNAFSAKQDS